MTIQKNPVYAIVPLRIGSTRVPKKNIRELAGKPLAAHMIQALNHSQYIDEVLVSTSSDEIETALRPYCSFKRIHRPQEMSNTTICGPGIFSHAANSYGISKTDIVILVDATHPFIKPEWIDETIEKLVNIPEAECAMLTTDAERPEFFLTPNENGILEHFHIPEAVQNGLDWSEYIQSIFEPSILLDGPRGISTYYYKSLIKHHNPFMKVPTVSVPIPKIHSFCVDTPEDWKMVEITAHYLKQQGEL